MKPAGGARSFDSEPPSAGEGSLGARRRRFGWLGAVLAVYWLGIFAATHLPQAALPQTHLGDKTEHFIAYGLLAFLMTAWLRLARARRRGVGLLVFAVCTAYAAVDELTQPIVNRFADFRDFLADAVGAGLGVLVGMFAFRRAGLGRTGGGDAAKIGAP